MNISAIWHHDYMFASVYVDTVHVYMVELTKNKTKTKTDEFIST